MNARFARLIGLMLTMALLLSGCNLIEIDAKMQAEEDIAKLDKAYSAVVASYNGGEITANEAMTLFNNTYNEMYYMYQYYFGMEMGADQVHELMDSSLSDMVRLEVTAAHFDQNHTLSDEELAQVETDAQAAYDEAYASLYEIAAGKDEEAKHHNTLVLLKEIGMDAETNYANTLLSAKAAKMEQLLMDEVAELSDEELAAVYEARVLADEESYSANDGSFESAMMDAEPGVCWMPEGYRTVKHILVIPDDALMTAYSDAEFALESQRNTLEGLEAELASVQDNDVETAENGGLLRSEAEIQADIEACAAMESQLAAELESTKQACLDSVKGRTDEIYARLNAGEDFEAVMAEYGEDPGMQNEPTKTAGYYVSAASVNWEQNFTNGAMALEKVGDYSAEPVLSGSGVHIIYYASDVTPGAVPLDEVRDALYADALEEAKFNHCDSVAAQWIDEAAPSYDVEAFEKAIFDSAE